MKSGVMATPPSPDVSIEMEQVMPSRVGRTRGLLPSMSEVRRAHSRSASWSLPGGRSSLPSGMGLSLNPIAPLTNVIREIVPSFDRLSRHSGSDGSNHVSREPSQNSLLLGTTGVEREGGEVVDGREQGEADTTESVAMPREHIAIPMGVQGAPDEQDVGLELSDSVRWLEQNAVFIILLMIKFAWYHRSGW